MVPVDRSRAPFDGAATRGAEERPCSRCCRPSAGATPRPLPGRWFYRRLRSGIVMRRAQVAHVIPADRSRAIFNGAATCGAEEQPCSRCCRPMGGS